MNILKFIKDFFNWDLGDWLKNLTQEDVEEDLHLREFK
jgi:hypothetical protein